MEKETFSEAVDLDGLQEIEEESKNNMDLKEQESTQQAQENIQNKDSDNMEASQSKESKEVETVFVNQSWQREEEVAQRTEQDLAGSEEKGPKEMVEIYVHPSARADRAELTQRRSEVVNGTVSSPSSKDTILDWKRAVKAKEKEERDSLTVWSNPFYTYKYCYLECEEQLAKIPDFIKQHMIYAQIVVLLTSILAAIYLTPGPHQPLMSQLEKTVCWCLYWFGLGVLSSIGLGTGLHTFLLYLGPHIASVTLAAYECGGLNFPEPPYPDEIVCPTVVDPVWMTSLWTIMCKVWVEAVMWGAGTAFGELPPYFMARTARLSGFDPDDEDELKEFQEFQRKKEEHPELLTYADQMKIVVENLVAKMGFFGILACASIPNPLFDLAGITCGHFLVPFWTFFGATLIGKALIKMMIQQMFVIVAFNEVLIANAVSRLTLIPFIGHKLQGPVTEFFKQQKKRLHRKDPSIVEVEGNWISDAFDLFVAFMFLYFIVSIVHSLAQSYHKRLSKKIAQNLDVNTTPFALEENEELQEALESALDKKD